MDNLSRRDFMKMVSIAIAAPGLPKDKPQSGLSRDCGGGRSSSASASITDLKSTPIYQGGYIRCRHRRDFVMDGEMILKFNEISTSAKNAAASLNNFKNQFEVVKKSLRGG